MAKVFSPFRISMKAGLLIFLVALLAGGAIGRKISFREEPEIARADERKLERGGSRAVWTSADFAREIESRTRGNDGYFEGDLKGWSDAEIRAALEESLTNPDCVVDSSEASELARQLFAEWLHRDFDAALVWFSGLNSEAAQRRMAWTLSRCWPEARADEGLEFLRSNREIFADFGAGGRLLVMGMSSAAKQGSEAFVRMLEQLDAEKFSFEPGALGLVGEAIPLPDDFDFKGFTETPMFGKLWDRNGV
jgi:hypothetical protein